MANFKIQQLKSLFQFFSDLLKKFLNRKALQSTIKFKGQNKAFFGILSFQVKNQLMIADISNCQYSTLFTINIYFMSEEKIRNSKVIATQSSSAESIPSFLLKTYEILQNPKYSDIICWTKNGEGFVVKKVKEFAENILPTHFRHSNYTSFVRQLNMYDFHKTRQENQENAFKNSMFKRGQKNLLKQIQRKDYKKKKEKPEGGERSGTMVNQNQVKDGKKSEHQKQFYVKGLTVLQKINQEMNIKQSQLAQIQDTNFKYTDQGISQVLELILGVKNSNNNWFNQLSVLNKEWQAVLNNKKSTLKAELESQRMQSVKKIQDLTMVSLNSFSHHN